MTHNSYCCMQALKYVRYTFKDDDHDDDDYGRNGSEFKCIK